MKKYILVFSTVLLLAPFLALAQVETAVEPDGITLDDLEISDPGILPTSNFYFFKEIVRGLRRAVTFNAVSRAELELKITNEKAAEVLAVKEKEPEKAEALEKALENYKKSAERLKSRFEALEETSENPNVDKLLDKLADRTLKHQQLFEELEAKHEELKDEIENAKEGLEETTADAAERLDTAKKLKERLEKAIEKQHEGNAKEIRAVGILDRLEEKAKDDNIKAKLSEIKENLIEKFDEKVEKRIIAPLAVPGILEALPISDSNRLRILENIKEHSGSAEVKIRLENVETRVKEGVKEEALGRKDEAERMIKTASELMEDLRKRINSGNYLNVPESVKSLFSRAENHIVNAKTAFEKEDYGEAFGQASAAVSAAKNAVSQLLRANVSPETGVVRKCGVNTFVVSNECASGGFGSLYFQCYGGYEERQADACRSSEDWQAYAKKICVNRCSTGTGATPSITPPSVRPMPAPNNTVCTKEYEPVCGVNGKTYGNACEARVAGVAVKSKGECPAAGTRTETKLAPTTVPR